jgi:hypothetical protein
MTAGTQQREGLRRGDSRGNFSLDGGGETRGGEQYAAENSCILGYQQSTNHLTKIRDHVLTLNGIAQMSLVLSKVPINYSESASRYGFAWHNGRRKQ